MRDQYIGLDPERFNAIRSRYKTFQDTLNDVSTSPTTVFNPLGKKQAVELELIREVSKELQAKKEEDVKKAAQAAMAPQAEKTEEVKEEKPEEKTEDVKEGKN